MGSALELRASGMKVLCLGCRGKGLAFIIQLGFMLKGEFGCELARTDWRRTMVPTVETSNPDIIKQKLIVTTIP